MVFYIKNGYGSWSDITQYMAHGGLKWSRNDVEAANAGRTQEGDMERDRVAIKYRFDITCRPLTASEQATLLQLIQPVFVDVRYTDPVTNTIQDGTFYSNNIPSTFSIVDSRGVDWWTGLAFPLVEK